MIHFDFNSRCSLMPHKTLTVTFIVLFPFLVHPAVPDLGYRASNAQAANRKPKYLFEIPTYPGMEQMPGPLDSSNRDPNITRVHKIYRTRDGSSVNAETVQAFYRSFYEQRGWKVSGDTSPSTLEMSVYVNENLPDQTHIQVAGNFFLLIAPKDGMFITYVYQSRHSNPDQATITRMGQILARMDRFAAREDYRKSEVASGGSWEAAFINEYLINWQQFDLWDKSIKKISDINPVGFVDIQVMTYSDAEIAKAEELRYQDSGKPIVQGNIVSLPVRSSGYRELVREDKVLLVIESPRGDRRELVQKLATWLRDE